MFEIESSYHDGGFSTNMSLEQYLIEYDDFTPSHTSSVAGEVESESSENSIENSFSTSVELEISDDSFSDSSSSSSNNSTLTLDNWRDDTYNHLIHEENPTSPITENRFSLNKIPIIDLVDSSVEISEMEDNEYEASKNTLSKKRKRIIPPSNSSLDDSSDCIILDSSKQTPVPTRRKKLPKLTRITHNPPKVNINIRDLRVSVSYDDEIEAKAFRPPLQKNRDTTLIIYTPESDNDIIKVYEEYII